MCWNDQIQEPVVDCTQRQRFLALLSRGVISPFEFSTSANAGTSDVVVQDSASTSSASRISRSVTVERCPVASNNSGHRGLSIFLQNIFVLMSKNMYNESNCMAFVP